MLSSWFEKIITILILNDNKCLFFFWYETLDSLWFLFRLMLYLHNISSELFICFIYLLLWYLILSRSWLTSFTHIMCLSLLLEGKDSVCYRFWSQISMVPIESHLYFLNYGWNFLKLFIPLLVWSQIKCKLNYWYLLGPRIFIRNVLSFSCISESPLSAIVSVTFKHSSFITIF